MDTDDIPEPSVQSKVALESKFENNQKAVLDIQRVVRGHQGRAVFAAHLAEHVNNHAEFEEERIRKWEEEERERKASEEKEKQIQAEKREAKLRLEKAQMMESKARALAEFCSLIRCSFKAAIRPLYTLSPSQTASPPCTELSNTETLASFLGSNSPFIEIRIFLLRLSGNFISPLG